MLHFKKHVFFPGNALITITKANLKGVLTGHEIWVIRETEIIPYEKTTLHLTEKQVTHFLQFSSDFPRTA